MNYKRMLLFLLLLLVLPVCLVVKGCGGRGLKGEYEYGLTDTVKVFVGPRSEFAWSRLTSFANGDEVRRIEYGRLSSSDTSWFLTRNDGRHTVAVHEYFVIDSIRYDTICYERKDCEVE